VSLLVVRKGEGRHELPERIQVTSAHGILGDRWSLAPKPSVDKQVTMMMAWAAAAVCDGQPLDRPGDNLLVDLDIGETAVPAGTVLRVGSVRLQVTPAPHLGCKKFAARFGDGALEWVNAEPNRPRKLRGINCTVLTDGEIGVGDEIVLER
jgi:MOSC domain-containing protein YiiM